MNGNFYCVVIILERNNVYHTRQKDLIYGILKESGSNHNTIDSITQALERNGTPVGKTTVYRYLKRLVEEGIVRKITIEGEKSDCYQYAENHEECKNHYHLRCDRCGDIIHTECRIMDELSEHIFSEHSFKLDLARCTLHGVCEKCIGTE